MNAERNETFQYLKELIVMDKFTEIFHSNLRLHTQKAGNKKEFAVQPTSGHAS